MLRPRASTAALACGLGLMCGAAPVFAGCALSRAPLKVAVSGDHLVDGAGQPVRLLGVNRSGPEYACVHGLGVFAGPADRRAITSMVTWHVNAVRIPLNEDCWLAINGTPARYSGAPYRNAVSRYVTLLHRAGVYAVLDLHWNAAGAVAATGQQPMADLDHSPAFWSSVARRFRNDPAVIFDLYNEPNGISWPCWRDGCTLGQLGQGRRAAGMQTLVDAVRSAGARQPVIAAGLGSASDLSQWLQFRPHDPAHQLIAGFHGYRNGGCSARACWNAQIGPVSRTVPVVASEIGETGCSPAFIDEFMNWADSHGVSYLAWSWNPSGCGSPALIDSWSGRPTRYGQGFRSHLLAHR